MSQETILQEIIDERIRQHKKWGEENHQPETWFLILGEEVGEAQKEFLEHRFPEFAKVEKDHLACYRQELVQVAAVAVAMLECFDRNIISETEVAAVLDVGEKLEQKESPAIETFLISPTVPSPAGLSVQKDGDEFWLRASFADGGKAGYNLGKAKEGTLKRTFLERLVQQFCLPAEEKTTTPPWLKAGTGRNAAKLGSFAEEFTNNSATKTGRFDVAKENVSATPQEEKEKPFPLAEQEKQKK